METVKADDPFRMPTLTRSLAHRDMQSEWERDCVSSKLHTVLGNLGYYE
jgi:hypothetical protein